MRMLKWIIGNTWKDEIQNKKICLKIGVVPIDEKMRKSLFRSFGHVQRKEVNKPVKKSELILVEGIKEKYMKAKNNISRSHKKMTCQFGNIKNDFKQNRMKEENTCGQLITLSSIHSRPQKIWD